MPSARSGAFTKGLSKRTLVVSSLLIREIVSSKKQPPVGARIEDAAGGR
jgi:hypothetical protein